MGHMLAKKWIYEFPYIFLAILIVSFLSTHSPNLELDVDPSYLLFGAARPPMYPLFIAAFHWAGRYQFEIIMWVQGLLLFTTLLYTRSWLRKNLKIPDFLIFLITLIVILTIAFHFQIWFIQSEGLAFPFFILTFFLVIECFKKFHLKKLFYLSSLVSFLVLTRLQFYYFYGIFVILIIWYLWQRIGIKQIFYGILILFGSMFFTILADYSYHYYQHGTFSGTSYGGLMVLVQALYMAEDDAENYFRNPTEKAYVQSMITERNIKQLNKDANLIGPLKPSYLQKAHQSYSRNYLAIQKIIDDTLNASIEKEINAAPNLKANAVALKIDKVLILHSLKKHVLFLLWKFITCMGGVPTFLFFLILLLAIPFQIIRDKIHDPDLSLIFVAVITMITFLNAAIIAICNPDLPVYFCYSQFMFYCLAAFIVSRTFIKKDNHGKVSLD